MNWPWDVLGLDGPSDLRQVRRAYAEKLKTIRPEEDPEGFQRLHRAYREASTRARRGESVTSEPPETKESLTPPEPPPEPETARRAADWDYVRLFMEAEAVQREIARRDYAVRVEKAVELLAECRKRRGFPERERDMERITALQALFMLEEPAPSGGWRLICEVFLSSRNFLRIREDPLFLACLERFFREHPTFPQGVRDAFFRAYGFGKRRLIPWKFWRLCRLLANDRIRETWRLNAQGLLLLALVFTAMLLFLTRYAPWTPWREQICLWLEEDFGRPFHTVSDWRYGTLFVPDGEPDLRFLAFRNGPRIPREGRRGYRTNYTGALLEQALAAFAEERGYELVPVNFQSRASMERAACYFRLPLSGAGESISALGELLESLEQESWFQELPPAYELYLCWQDWCFFHGEFPEEGPLDTTEIRAYYEAEFGPAMCRVIAEKTGTVSPADAADTEEGGMIAIGDETFFWSGLWHAPPPHGQSLCLCLLSLDGRALFRVPADIPLPALSELRAGPSRHRSMVGIPGGVDVYVSIHTMIENSSS